MTKGTNLNNSIDIIQCFFIDINAFFLFNKSVTCYLSKEKAMENELNLIWKKKLLFASVFVHENQLHSIMDRYLTDISCKQWLLLVASDAFPTMPCLSDVGKHMGCSRQNVKKLAVSLEKLGYIKLVTSKTDGRNLCIEILSKGKKIINDSVKLEKNVHDSIFKDFSESEINLYFELSNKMVKGFGYLEEKFQELRNLGEM